MKTMRNLLTVLFVAAVCLASAQTTTFPVNGTVDKHTTYTAFTNATVQVDPSTQLQNATLLVKNGRVVAVGTEVGAQRLLARRRGDAVNVDFLVHEAA